DQSVTYAAAVAWKTDLVVLGFGLADETLMSETEQALRWAESTGDAYALSLARWAHGTVLLRSDDAHRALGIDLLRQSCEEGMNSSQAWCEADFGEELARHSRLDTAIDTVRAAVQSEINTRHPLFAGYPAAVLVRLLTQRGATGDWEQARDVVTQLETQQ